MKVGIPAGFITPNFFFLNVFLSYLFIYLRVNKQGRGGERERVGKGWREMGQRIQSGLCADSRKLDAGLELTNCEIMT